MIQPHQQLFRHDPDNGIYGDCWRTVIACLLHLPPEQVPHVCNGPDDGQADARMQSWLADRGLALIGVNFNGDCDLDHILKVGASYSAGMHWMLTGKSRTGVNHVVICRGDRIIHDTSIDQSGIIAPALSGFWLIEWLVRRLPCDLMEAA
jgi:hypothetical protein